MNKFWHGFRNCFEFYFGWCGLPKKSHFYYDSKTFMWGGVLASVIMAITLVMGTILLVGAI